MQLKCYSKTTNAAGNFYINDKPTGAVVGQQPFGGARVWNKRQSRFSIELIALGYQAIKETL
jgi:1-pyrroline-5-carboxylate dehydrogenase